MAPPVQGPIPYSTVTAHWFDRQRGLALGIGMAGVVPIFIAYEVMLFVTCTIFLRLGAYPYPARQEESGATASVNVPA